TCGTLGISIFGGGGGGGGGGSNSGEVPGISVCAKLPCPAESAARTSRMDSVAFMEDMSCASRSRATGLLFRRVLDRIKSCCVEAKQVPRLLHVRRQRGARVDHAATRVRDHDAAREQMQPVLQAARQFPVLDVEIFGVADDGMADMGRVG